MISSRNLNKEESKTTITSSEEKIAPSRYRHRLQLRRIKDIRSELPIFYEACKISVLLYGLPEEATETILYTWLCQQKEKIIKQITLLAKDSSQTSEIEKFSESLINQLSDALTYNRNDDLMVSEINALFKKDEMAFHGFGILKTIENKQSEAKAFIEAYKVEKESLLVSQQHWKRLQQMAKMNIPLLQRLQRAYEPYYLMIVLVYTPLILFLRIANAAMMTENPVSNFFIAGKSVIERLFLRENAIFLLFYVALNVYSAVKVMMPKPVGNIDPEYEFSDVFQAALMNYSHHRISDNNHQDYKDLIEILPEMTSHVLAPPISDEAPIEEKKNHKQQDKKPKRLSTKEIIQQQIKARQLALETKEIKSDLHFQNTHYIRLLSMQGYIKLNAKELEALHPEKAKRDKAGINITKRFFDEVRKNRVTHKLTDTEITSAKSPYQGLDTKVRLGGNAYRLGLKIRKPTDAEVALGISENEQVQSPKIIVQHNRAGYK